MKAIFTAICFASAFAPMAYGQRNVIEEKTIDVSFDPEELSLTCRMGLNGLSYISLNAPSLNQALAASVVLKETATPILQLTSPFTSTSVHCQETNVELTKFIIESGDRTTAHIKISLVESTLSAHGITSRVLREDFELVLNEHLKFHNEGSIVLERRHDP